MNDRFKKAISTNSISLYRLSKETGIPYTTLSELMNDKKNINNIAAETVYKLCLYFNCRQEELLNNCFLLENSEGKYNRIKYYWKSNDSIIELHIEDNNKDIILLSLNNMFADAYHEYRRGITPLLIDIYLKNKELEAALYE